MPGFDDADEGKRVVAQDGRTVGTVVEIRDGTPLVEPVADLDPELKSELRWDGTVNREVHRLNVRFVNDIGDEVVRLRV